MRIIVERPADRHLDQFRFLAVAVWLADLGLIAAPRAIGPIIGAHQARIVDKAVGEQEIDRVLAQLPRRGAVAARLATGQRGDGIIGADEISFLLGATLLRGRNMRPAVMRDFMAVAHDRLARAWMALDGEARNEPGGADAVRLEQSEDALRANKAELAARERRRAGHTAGDEPGLRVEVEAQADDVARHPALPNVDTGANCIA